MNKDVMLKVKIDEARTIKYFQPIITNNTVIIPAKRLQDDMSETTDKSPVYKNITEKQEEKVQPKYKNLIDNDSKVIENEKIAFINDEEKNEEKNDELKIEEIVIEENKEQNINNDFMMKLEDMAKIFEENQKKEEQNKENNNRSELNILKEESEDIADIIEDDAIEEEVINEDITEDDTIEEKAINEDIAQEENINKDVTSKLDLPYEEGMKTESIPQRREMVDNLNEMKAKLFLLASNAKKPVRICVNKKVFLMGSDYAKMDCVIRNNRYISRCHAKIYYEASCYFIEDVGSMNGTYINGVKLAEGIKYKLETGDTINLADCKFEVDIKN